MTLEEFVAILSDEYATAEFEYNGQQCGVEPQTQDSETTYTTVSYTHLTLPTNSLV